MAELSGGYSIPGGPGDGITPDGQYLYTKRRDTIRNWLRIALIRLVVGRYSVIANVHIDASDGSLSLRPMREKESFVDLQNAVLSTDRITWMSRWDSLRRPLVASIVPTHPDDNDVGDGES